MKRLLFTALAATTLFTPAANAAGLDQGWYLGLGGGWNHAEDADFARAGVKNSASYDEGWLAGASVGYAWRQGWRTELALDYRTNSVDKLTGTGASGGSGDFQSWNLMTNLFYDFKNDTRWVPYIGAGIGASFQNADGIKNVFVGATQVDSKSTEFAYQGMAGLDYWVTPRAALGVRYNYFATTDGHFKTDVGAVRNTDGEYGNHAVMVTYRLGFSKPAAAPAAPAPMPLAEPAPAPVMPPVQTMPVVQQAPTMVPAQFTVFFANDSAALSPQANSVIENALRSINTLNSQMIEVTGYTDTTASNAYNQQLAMQRAEAVRSSLVARGVAANRIQVVSLGENNTPVMTADGVIEPRNRVAVIILK